MYKSLTAYLWVEDGETATYLRSVWTDPRIGIYVAGGCESVRAAVEAARRDGYAHVFGFRDRDFGATNRRQWRDDTVSILVSDAFEVENLMLDCEAIADCDVCDSGMSAQTIEVELVRLAGPLAWWMACRRTIVELRESVFADFIEHPTRSRIGGRQDAIDEIVNSEWWRTRLPQVPHWNAARIEAAVDGHYATYEPMVANGKWRNAYSGKEILRDVVTRVWHKGRQGDPQDRLDLARSIGLAQVAQKRVPQEVVDLRGAILYKVGLPG